MPAELAPANDGADAATDVKIVAAVQRGLNSLGFLHGKIDGVAGEATAKAIRNFEVYYNYDVTGRITRELVDLLAQQRSGDLAGACCAPTSGSPPSSGVTTISARSASCRAAATPSPARSSSRSITSTAPCRC